MHCTWRNVRIPPDPAWSPPHRHPATTAAAACCSRTATTTPIRHRSPGQTGHEESPAESYSQHTHTHTRYVPTLPLCAALLYISLHIYLYTAYTYILAYIYVSSRRPPRLSATSRPYQGSLYCVIGISRAHLSVLQLSLLLPSLPFVPSPLPCPNCCAPPAHPPPNVPPTYCRLRVRHKRVCVRVYINVYSRVLPGTCLRINVFIIYYQCYYYYYYY